MTIEAIRAAIEQLTQPERRELADWFEQLEEQAWDAEMEQDLSPAGRGHHLVEKINQEIRRPSGPVSAGDFRVWIGQRECSGGAACLFPGSW